jgi:hypothetical protein
MTILQHSIAQAAAAGGYQIARSLRFNSGDSAFLNRTPSSAGNRRTWTWSGWVKPSNTGTVKYKSLIEGIGSSPAGTRTTFIISDDGTIQFFTDNASTSLLITTQVLRDFSAWYHIVLAVDTTQATSSNRIKLYLNGVQVTSFSTATYPSQNLDTQINNTYSHTIGKVNDPFYADYYLTELNLIDGQALDATSFGEFDTNTGVWNPKTYSGTYGTNGFNLKFADNSNTTAATLGKDSSSNANNWTPNNFSVTAGVGNDSLVDTPTNYGTDTGVGGEVRGNYCTLNPLAASSSSAALTNGNLDISIAANVAGAMGTMAVQSGKWYWEFTAGTASQNAYYVSVCDTAVWFPVGNSQSNMYSSAGVYSYYGNDGNKINGGSASAYGSSFTSGDVIGIALDLDNGKVWFAKNGTWQNSGSPTGGTNAAFTTLAGKTMAPWIGNGASSTSSAGVINFGQRSFAYTAPSGFKALCTQNLPTPAIGATSSTLASKNMNVALYTGNGTSSATTQAITGVGFQPDLVWIKNRSSAAYHVLTDAVRGTTAILSSNATDAESAFDATWRSQYGQLTAFGSDGFTVAAGTVAGGNFNYSGQTYVGWAFKGGNGTVSNTSGSITSTVSANPTAGISIATYTAPSASGDFTFGHGLGVAPKLFITRFTSTSNWAVYHQSVGANAFLKLNSTDASTSSSGCWGTGPTSSLITVKQSAILGGAGACIAYAFAEVAGFSKIGSYTGNGSTDGPFVYCGFRPRYVMLKSSSGTTNWIVEDSARSPANVVSALLNPNAANVENTSVAEMDFLSNGFKIKTTDAGYNSSGGTYIFAAFAEAPFNYARAR